MAGLKKIVGLTLAVVLVIALVVYVLRPSATSTTTRTAQPETPTVQPPTQGTCTTRSVVHHGSDCGNTTGGGHDSEQDNETGDHDDASGHSDDNETCDHEGHDWESDRNETGNADGGHDSDWDVEDDS